MRPLSTSDLKAVHAYSGNAENTKYVSGLPNKDENETLSYLEWVENEWTKAKAQRYFGFAAVLFDEVIGEIAFGLDKDFKNASAGWIFHRDYWCMGYACEAVEAVFRYCFNELKYNKITASCDNENSACLRLMRKLGMKEENRKEKLEYRDGRISSASIFSIYKNNDN